MSVPSSAVIPPLSMRAGLVLAALLLAAVLFLSLPNDLLWQRVLEDSGHGPVFACLAVVLLWLQTPRDGSALRTFNQYHQVFVIAVAFGVATELAQWFLPDRNVSARDVLHDAAGAAFGLVFAWAIERRVARRQGAVVSSGNAPLAVAIALASFMVLGWQPLQCARAYAERAAAWPSLLPTGEIGDDAFVRSERARLSHAPLPARYAGPRDGKSLRLQFDAGSRPALQLREPKPDWSGKVVLLLDVTNPSAQPVHFKLRILDRTHDWSNNDRFNQVLIFPAATRSTVRISLAAVASAPHDRRMDMTAIADVLLFAARPLDAGELYVTRIALE